MKIVITASILLTPLEQIAEPLLVVEDGRVLHVTSRERAEIPGGAHVVDFPGAVLAPGFVDIHIHGGAGHDLMHLNADALEAIERSLVAQGVTSYFPTTVSAPLDQTFVALERLAAAIETAPARGRGGMNSAATRASKSAGKGNGALRAQPLGIHLEGPFISPAKRGVHPEEDLQLPSLEVFDRLWQAARGQVSLVTLAPELPKSEYLIGEASRRGVCVSLGHSDGTLEDVQHAIAAGARHATHTFNAMRALQHREPGMVGAVLAEDRLTADIIADGIHVHPEVVRLFLRAKGAERAVLITDAVSATGMPEGRYRLGSFEVDVKDGRCQYQGRLAGSVLTLDRAVRNVMEFTGCSLQDAVRLATLNPARVAGVAGRKGMLAEGADADLVVLTPRGEVVDTIVASQGVSS